MRSAARRAALAAGLSLPALALPVAASAAEQKLVAPDGATGFGTSVAVEGNTAVVGSHADDRSRGAAYVFVRSRDRWRRTARLTASDAASTDLGWSVAIDGDTIVAGARGDNAHPGAVYTFTGSGDDWTETAKLIASDGTAADFLGWSVAIDGDTIVSGAPRQEAVYTFTRDGGDRTETAKLTASNGPPGSLGHSVAIDGDTIVAGAPSDHVGGSAAQGSAYTFARTGPSLRTETAKLVSSDGSAGDSFGESVAIEDHTIAVGAELHDEEHLNQGAVYTFARTGPRLRTETAELTASDSEPGGEDPLFPALGDWLGLSVAVDADRIVAGAPQPTGQGAVYKFTRRGSDRTEVRKLTASGGDGDWLGESVAVDGPTVIAGAPQDSSAWIFFPATAPGPNGPPARCGGVRATIVGRGTATRLTGTPRRDVIVGTAGEDLIRGREGRDLVCANGGKDRVRGGPGGDELRGGRGRDACFGGAGSDRLKGCELPRTR